MRRFNFKREVTLNDDNFLTFNLIDKYDVKRKKINGKYIYEKFYLIDFLDIRENSYVISSFGRLFSLLTKTELKPNVSKRDGYKAIYLTTTIGKRCKFPISRLVARAFVPKTSTDKKMNRLFVHHKNWDNDYNYYWNLEWRSKPEVLLMSRINNKDIDEADIAKIVCIFLENNETIVDIFEMIDGKMSKDKISKIKNKKIYTEISEKYDF